MKTENARNAGKIAQPLIAVGMNIVLRGRFNVQCIKYLSKEDLEGKDLRIRDLLTNEIRYMQIKTGQGNYGDKYLCIDVINRNGEDVNIESIIKKFQFGLMFLNDNKLYMPPSSKLLELVQNELNQKRLCNGFHYKNGKRIYDNSRYIRIYRKDIINITKLFLTLPEEVLYGTKV